MRWLLIVVLCVAGCSLDRGPKQAANRIGNHGGAADGGGSADAAGISHIGGASGHGAAGIDVGGAGVGSAGMGAAGTGVDACGGCDDGVFCNGSEHCMPGDALANSRGCISTPACVAGQTCNEAANSCDTQCAMGSDADFDGFIAASCGGNDCNDASALSNPSGFELCDGLDNDCNGAVDDGFAQFSCFGDNSLASCIAGQCVITACSDGFADCDKVASNGCEFILDPTRGDCQTTDCMGSVIEAPNDVPFEDGDECTIESCDGSMPVSENAPDDTTCEDTGSCNNGKCKQPDG